jgi:diguanylate cyclase (GGDEF)-like protein
MIKQSRPGLLWEQLNTRQRFLVIQVLIFAFAIFPLGFYRLSQGQIAQALFDAILFLTLILLVALALKDHFFELSTRIMSITYVIAVYVVVDLTGQVGLFWAFVAVLGGFFTTKAHQALFSCLMMYLLIFYQDFGGADYPTIITFSACFALVVAFGYYFSSRLWRENARLDKQANLDPLTDLPNRRLLEDDLERLLSRQIHELRENTMLVIDIDHFKSINDDFGHETGDRVLRGIATLLRITLPNESKLYRLAGEEFVVLCPHSLEAAVTVAELMCERIAKTKLLRDTDRQITVSIGVAQRTAKDDYRSWFQRADSALYQAKRKGRNQVVYG